MILPVFIIFLAILTIAIRRNDRAQQDVQEKFWKREQEANFTRKKDLSNLEYIQFPSELLSSGLQTPAKDALQKLSGEKMINLTHMTNTDVKLAYGAQNLDILTHYENNYVDMITQLTVYAQELLDAGETATAQKLLEFAVSTASDSIKVYELLSTIYKEQNAPEKITALHEQVSAMDCLTKNAILSRLV